MIKISNEPIDDRNYYDLMKIGEVYDAGKILRNRTGFMIDLAGILNVVFSPKTFKQNPCHGNMHITRLS